MARHILVPIDDSEQARNALNYAVTEYPDEEITIYHALDPVDVNPYGGLEGGSVMPDSEEIQAQRQEQAEQLLAEAKEQADEHDVTTQRADV